MLRSKKFAVVISYLNLFVSLITTVFFIPFLLKKVGDDYGVFSFSESIISWLTILSTTFASCYVRFATIEEKNTGRKPTRTNTIFLLLLFCVSLFALFAGLIILALFMSGVLSLPSFSDSETHLFYWVFFLAVIHSSTEIAISFFSLYTTYERYFVVVRGVLLINAILYPSLSIIALLNGGGMLIVIVVMFATKILLNLLVVLFALIKLHVRFEKIKLTECKPLITEIILFSLFILVETIVETCNISLDKIFLGAMCGAHLVAVYQLGMTYTTYINSISCAMTNNFIPQIHEYAQNGDVDAINSLFTKISTFQLLILTMVVGGYLTCGYEFTLIWVGKENIEVYFIAATLMLAFLFDYSTAISIEYQRSVNKHKFRTVVQLISLLFNFGITGSLLVFFKNVNPIVSCLVGTVFSELVFKTIVLSVYNTVKLKLSYRVIIQRFLILLSIAIFAFLFSQGMLNVMFSSLVDNAFYSFLIKGGFFVIVYIPSAVIAAKYLFKIDILKVIFKSK